MATKITLTLPKSLSEREQHELRLLIKDSLHEFATKRYPAPAYVDARYPALSPVEAQIKAQQVGRRVDLARALHDAAFDMTITVEHTNHALCKALCGPECLRPEDDS